MANTKANAMRDGEGNVEQEVSLQDPIVPIGEYVFNEKIRYHFLLLSQVGIKILEFYGSKIK